MVFWKDACQGDTFGLGVGQGTLLVASVFGDHDSFCVVGSYLLEFGVEFFYLVY